MATTYVALLRGINVGKAKRVAMADLRAVIESLGYANARTLLNSGNAVFEATRALRKDAAEQLRQALQKKSGVSSRFTLRSSAQLAAIVEANPLLDLATDHTRRFAAFLIGPGVAYIWCPNGLLESKATVAVGKALGDGVTVRNWATVMKLTALASA